ncbi:MAG: Rod shape-determining protein MreB [Candidatus Amesbacteria bacterium GW2011_GWA1_47_16]|uniref:Cell shape-determining protein MreB n=4 Tax=Candidatus Amesiibacteriota TaxID=1752730 RepID=A0A0G1UUI9_9BACT|nr:MAG: Rod shape-determining protein MreB [Candidatus Amesbacteria bacterium GW2011_GWA1_47_16]KKU97852.1 MAG: Rod shape-determining protein MreB [Candidatus Amesbacteria bacterium GW2011_GWB1_48_13]OGD00080.1 MAG: rod shape-determining protein [Candidatus Amesbacteria bacterium RIFCSPLOWO2_01_FULL_47_33]OGD00226.1 MAG: rod shape-determining protein [Candidatus Amesbacteria bacterium RIFCSPHIGHO2_01_FULL_47_34]
MLDYLFGLLSYDVGIDLGTANTLVHVKGKGIMIREPSVVARHRKTKQILAIGEEAKKMLGRTPATIEALRPLKDGVIADFDATEDMLKHYIQRVHESGRLIPRIPKPRVVVGIPSGVTEVERRAVQEAALSAGARQCFLIEEPMAAAIGAGLPIGDAGGVMVVDIGGGTSEIAVISLGGIVANKSIRVAGDELDEAIIHFIRLKYNVLLGERTAEDIKITLGNAHPNAFGEVQSGGGDAEQVKKSQVRYMVVRGRDLESGLPRSLKISSDEVREAMMPVLTQITSAAADLIEETPPELVADVLERGIVMAGGGSLIAGMDKLMSEETQMPVFVTDDPMTAVVRGCAKVLEDNELLKRVKVVGGLR